MHAAVELMATDGLQQFLKEMDWQRQKCRKYFTKQLSTYTSQTPRKLQEHTLF